MLTKGFLLIFFVFYCQSVLADQSLWSALQEGGKVIVMRHAPVEKGKGKGNSLKRDPSCKKERNLSKEGIKQAKKIGEIFRKKNVPVEKVLHSPFCRTTDTAKLAFENVSPSDLLYLLEVLPADKAMEQTEKLSQLIGSFNGKGNLVLITHEPNIRPISFETIKYMDFVVMKPEGEDQYDELGVIRLLE